MSTAPDMIESLFILSTLLLTTYISLLLYYRKAWNDIPVPPTRLSHGHNTFISVIIPARNEEKNIPDLLQSLAEQDYPAILFEVLVIDDHSEDATASMVKLHAGPNMTLISLENYMPNGAINSYKKKAIETGIAHSKGKLIVTTDADCYLQPGWLTSIASFYEINGPAFIAAPVAIDCGPRFIEIFQAMDFMTLQGITGASVYRKMHSMCNGANMAYEKSAFENVGGFKGIDKIASGDDMLLMHKISRMYPGRAMFLKSREAIVYTRPVRTVREFFRQRIRWASKADKFDDKKIFAVLVLVYALNLLLLILPIIYLFNQELFAAANLKFSIFTFWLAAMGLKTAAEIWFLIPVAAFFRKQNLLLLFPIMAPLHVIYTVVAGWLGKFGNYEWKGRRVK